MKTFKDFCIDMLYAIVFVLIYCISLYFIYGSQPTDRSDIEGFIIGVICGFAGCGFRLMIKEIKK